MHKYKPRVHVVVHEPCLDVSQIAALPTEGVCTFSFPETQFTTVTAYQNQQVKAPLLNPQLILKTQLMFRIKTSQWTQLASVRVLLKYRALEPQGDISICTLYAVLGLSKLLH